MRLTYESKLALCPLSIRKDKKHYIVEDEETGAFYEMPKVCIDAIEMINKSVPLEEIEKVLKDEYPQDEVNIIDFVNQLLELELVSELNGKGIARNTGSNFLSGNEWIPSALGRFFFNSFTTKVYVGLFIASLLLLIFNPYLLPSYTDIFVFDLMLKNVAAWMVISFLLVLLHEFGHVLAVRSENLPARIGLGHRLFFLVLETDMSQVWKLPAEKRNKLYLAGMYFDITVLCIALGAQLFIVESAIMTGLLKLVVLDTFIRLVYQAGVFMKTDLYYLIENKTGCYNLMENGRDFLSRWLPFLKVKNSEIFEGEEKFVRPYAVFYLTGVALTIAVAFYFYIPQLIFAMDQMMLPGLAEPVNSIRFWDSAVFLLQIVLTLSLLVYSWSKKYRYSS